jgi:hypothetical protein
MCRLFDSILPGTVRDPTALDVRQSIRVAAGRQTRSQSAGSRCQGPLMKMPFREIVHRDRSWFAHCRMHLAAR